MIDVTYNSFNGKQFYFMTKEELVVALGVIKDTVDIYAGNIKAINEKELWQAYQNCILNLNKFN